MQLHLFEQVDQVVRAMVPDGFGVYRSRTYRSGIKLWFGPIKPPRQHYEAQFISYRHLDTDTRQPDGRVAMEIGFHAEHPEENRNQAALDSIVAARQQWSKLLGPEPEADVFLGRDSWRRLSEVWFDVDPADDELAFELASRLIDYVEAIEPLVSDTSLVERP